MNFMQMKYLVLKNPTKKPQTNKQISPKKQKVSWLEKEIVRENTKEPEGWRAFIPHSEEE